MDLNGIIDGFKDKNDIIFKEKCLLISKDIRNGKITIVDLIQHLGSLLTNENVYNRELGTSILTEVLKNIPIDFLNSQQLLALTEFFNSKLNDHHQIFPAALSGILTLIQFENFPREKISELLNSIFHHVPCQQQQRADRYTIFQIFEVSHKLFKEELMDMKLEFIYGVLSSIEGERDPRNLLFLFKWMKSFLCQFSLQHLSEDMFDVLSCYFPIDFRAPSNDNSVTRENLAEALSPCLCSIADFGDSCISLALEKLDSSLEIAKIDSLKLLKEGCSTFETSVYLDKASEIWSMIEKEILTTNSDEIRLDCLITLSTFICKITEGVEESYLMILQNICDTLKGNLLPDSKLFDKSAQILVYVSSGSEKSCKYVLTEVIPILTNIYNMTAYNDQRSIIVKTLIEFTKVHLKFNKTLADEAIPELLKVPILSLEVLNFEGSHRKIGFDCLVILVPYLTLEIRQKLYIYLQSSIFACNDSETNNSFLQCLKTTASYYPDEVKQQVFSTITTQSTLVDPLLKSMAALINLKEFRGYVIENYLQAIRNVEFLKIAIQNVRCLVEKERNIGLFTELIETTLLDTLLDLIVGNNSVEMDVCHDVSIILRTLISPQTSEIQKQILQKYFEIIFGKIQDCEIFLLVLNGLVAPLRRDVGVDYKVLNVCCNLSCISQNEDVRNVAGQLLANLVNKRTSDESLIKYLETTREKCEFALITTSKNAIITSTWITKALLMRNHPRGLEWLDWLLQLLEHYSNTPEGLKIIMNDNYESLSTSLHCNKSLLYRQKAFVYITNKICERYDPSKMSYLTALGYTLEFTPLQAVLIQFPKISKFIILCLEKIDEPDVLIVLLNVITTICNSNSRLLETNLEDFLDRILNLSTFALSMKVRRASLKCLVMITTIYPVYKLLPFKSVVLHKLDSCVDDKKRLVRKEAMEAKLLWYMLDSPV